MAPPPTEHICCEHSTAVTGFDPQPPTGAPRFICQLALCCNCGKLRALYNGIVEEGHGPFVSFQQPEPQPAIMPVKTKLVLPGHA